MAFVIGTAGHIDHGKTALVRQLSGQDTDRLPAEKQRGISIDLGFAHFTLADGTLVGIVDVPGHERFIRNMVAGAHGLDLVLFVVAADDGVMPQTEEHFDILCSLGVQQAIFVVTKLDRVAPERFTDVADEIEILTDGSRFAAAKILPVNALTGEGVAPLRLEIEALLHGAETVDTARPFRMPIDRVFTVHGRGVVITGTQLCGQIRVGDEVAVVPGARVYRVRGVQSHGVDVACGVGQDRLAINLIGAERRDFRRGDVVCDPQIAQATDVVDVSLSVAAHAVTGLKHGQRLRLHLGTAERICTLILLEPGGRLLRGGRGMAQLRLQGALQVMAGDRFVIRDVQGEHTLGGGLVLDAAAPKARRDAPKRLAFLEALAKGDVGLAIRHFLDGSANVGYPEVGLQRRLNLTTLQIQAAIADYPDLIRLPDGGGAWITSTANLQLLLGAVCDSLAQYHKAMRISDGPGLGELHHLAARRIDPWLFRLALARWVTSGHLSHFEGAYALPSHRVGLTPEQQKQADALLAALEVAAFAPPRWDIKNTDVAVIITYLEQRGKLVRIAPGLAFARSAYVAADQLLEQHLLQHGSITAAQFRDLLGSSRKYALALLETFDRKGRTVRVGDLRKRGRPLVAP